MFLSVFNMVACDRINLPPLRRETELLSREVYTYHLPDCRNKSLPVRKKMNRKKGVIMSAKKSDLLKVIHRKCMDCTYDQIKEVQLCPAKDCPNWLYRMGKDPEKKPQSEAQRKARLEALQKANDAKKHHGYAEINGTFF